MSIVTYPKACLNIQQAFVGKLVDHTDATPNGASCEGGRWLAWSGLTDGLRMSRQQALCDTNDGKRLNDDYRPRITIRSAHAFVF